jgi:hypothetical protein
MGRLNSRAKRNKLWNHILFLKMKRDGTIPPRVDHLDVVGRLTPSKNRNPESTKRPDLNTQI